MALAEDKAADMFLHLFLHCRSCLLLVGVLGVLSGLLGLASSAVPQAKTAWKVGLGVVTGISNNVLGYYK